MIMAVASPQVELLISLFFSEDDVNFSYVSYISTSGITTLHTQDIFLEKIKNHANNLIGDLIAVVFPISRYQDRTTAIYLRTCPLYNGKLSKLELPHPICSIVTNQVKKV